MTTVGHGGHTTAARLDIPLPAGEKAGRPQHFTGRRHGHCSYSIFRFFLHLPCQHRCLTSHLLLAPCYAAVIINGGKS